VLRLSDIWFIVSQARLSGLGGDGFGMFLFESTNRTNIHAPSFIDIEETPESGVQNPFTPRAGRQRAVQKRLRIEVGEYFPGEFRGKLDNGVHVKNWIESFDHCGDA
jgi:hypothetical protein